MLSLYRILYDAAAAAMAQTANITTLNVSYGRDHYGGAIYNGILGGCYNERSTSMLAGVAPMIGIRILLTSSAQTLLPRVIWHAYTQKRLGDAMGGDAVVHREARTQNGTRRCDYDGVEQKEKTLEGAR